MPELKGKCSSCGQPVLLRGKPDKYEWKCPACGARGFVGDGWIRRWI